MPLIVARSAERLVGKFAYFVEEGDSVDSQTISSLIVPDNSPLSNWPSMGSVLPGPQWEVEEVDDSYLKAMPGGGFKKITRKIPIATALKFQTREMSGFADRLEYGLASKIVEGTPQSPDAATDRLIRGWLLIHNRLIGGNGTGTDDSRYLGWGELRLAEQPKGENKVISPMFIFHQLPGIALASVNFPAAA